MKMNCMFNEIPVAFFQPQLVFLHVTHRNTYQITEAFLRQWAKSVFKSTNKQ